MRTEQELEDAHEELHILLDTHTIPEKYKFILSCYLEMLHWISGRHEEFDKAIKQSIRLRRAIKNSELN